MMGEELERSHSEPVNMSICAQEDSPQIKYSETKYLPVPEPNRLPIIRENEPLSMKKERKLQGMQAQKVRTILQKDIVKFCQDLGLVATAVKCTCGSPMRLSPRLCSTDGFLWRCRKGGHTCALSMRKGTWFEKSKLSIFDILWIAYMWVYEYSYISMMHECDHSPRTLIEWLSGCRDVCQAIMNNKCNAIGGGNVSVEFMECKFSESKKTEQCRKIKKCDADTQWVFCAIEQFSTKAVLIVVKDHKTDTILQIFEKYILPGTTVFSNVWNAYCHLNKEGFEFLTNEKTITFYDSVSKEEIDNFENFREITERLISEEHYLEYDSMFYESMYRKSLAFASDAYLTFLKDIAKIYTPCDKIP